MASQDVKQRARKNLMVEDNHTRAYNNQHRLDYEDYTINSGDSVVGVFNKSMCSFGYEDSKFYIDSNGEQYTKAEEFIAELQKLTLTTEFDGLSWNGKILNPALLNKKLTYLSEKAISNLLNINNSAKDIEQLTGDDIHQVEIFGDSLDVMNKINKDYPVVNITGWKYEPVQPRFSRMERKQA